MTIGVIVRATDSGMGCPDWPLCHGQLIPPLDDYQAWIEWVHRTRRGRRSGSWCSAWRSLAIRDHRDRPVDPVAVARRRALVGFQAWLGRETVRLGNTGESVTAHLAAAMALVGLLVYILVRVRSIRRGSAAAAASQRFTLLAAFGAAGGRSRCSCSGRR